MQHAISLVRSTHDHEYSLRAAADLTRILLHVAEGIPIRKVLAELPIPGVSVSRFMNWVDLPDRVVVGEKLSTACYLPNPLLPPCTSHGNTTMISPSLFCRMQRWGRQLSPGRGGGGVLGLDAEYPGNGYATSFRWRIYGAIYGPPKVSVFE